ncbi:GatB/YqeY domain-containing protein [Saccharothrix sp. BKS2]|uniref:GatB/YqeY domain-containing protein n=1 Tax=Saccharothrix sp. BKS2 TaxID=3064400 RepID=UPI0039EB629D
MAELKARLQADLTAAIKNRETVRAGALRMALTAVTTEEVSGKAARELSDDEVQKVITREVKKRKEAAEAFAGAGRAEKAELERAESEVLEAYLPAQLSDDELAALVDGVLATLAGESGERPGMKQMGQVMKAVNAEVAGRAEGGRVAAAVKSKLAQRTG